MRLATFFIALTVLGCGAGSSTTGPRECTSSADCRPESPFCGDPNTGLIFGYGEERIPPGTVGQCCANGNVAIAAGSRGGVYGCDNLCGGTGENDGNPKYGCFKKLKDAFNARLRECDQPCTADSECVRGAFCDTSSGSGKCVPRTCAECWQTGADCFYSTTKCSSAVRSIISTGTYLEVECKPRICPVPCETAAQCPSGASCLATATGKQCLPSTCSTCFSSQKRCELDPYTCKQLACSGCVPSCAGKQCGSDGCSGSCGACPNTTDVCYQGGCVACPDAGKTCDPSSPLPCRKYTISCASGMSRCTATGTDTGAACTVEGQPGTCTSIGSCRANDPVGGTTGGTTTGGTTTGGTTGGSTCGASSCIAVVEYVDDTVGDYFCARKFGAGSDGYHYIVRNTCSSPVYCALCAGGPADCRRWLLAPGEDFDEWLAGANWHCKPPDSGLFVHCVRDEYSCRKALDDKYAPYLRYD